MVGLHRIQLLICGKVTCAYALHIGDICGQEVTLQTLQTLVLGGDEWSNL